MCEHCLMAELHDEWIEPLVAMMRLDCLLFCLDREDTEASIIALRCTRSPFYVPMRIRRAITEDMLTRRHN